MKTIVVANQKGGVGKTTVARHLTFYGVEKGLRVLTIDLDGQGNFSDTFKNIENANGYRAKREELSPGQQGLVASGLFDAANKRAPVLCSERLHYIGADSGMLAVERGDLATVIAIGQKRLAKLAKDFDVCVIDTGPSVSNLLIVALAVGDFAVSPCKPDRDAIKGLASFFSNVVRVRDESGVNPKLASLGVLPNQINKSRSSHVSGVASMREAWGSGVLPVELYERAAIDVAKDRAVWRTDRGESRGLAAKEMKSVCAHIYKQMGL